MSGLILRCGGWGASYARKRGKPCFSSDYAVACQQLRVPCLCYMIPQENEEEMMRCLSLDYGQHYYDA